jgi:hypothetical protein
LPCHQEGSKYGESAGSSKHVTEVTPYKYKRERLSFINILKWKNTLNIRLNYYILEYVSYHFYGKDFTSNFFLKFEI